MKALTTLCLGIFLYAGLAHADDRLNFTANGSTLTDSDGGAGGAVGLTHELSPGNLLGVGVEHQTIADAHWTFGTLRGALTRGKNVRWTLFGEANYGSGRVGTRSFTHAMENGGLAVTFPFGLTLQLEDKQIDIDTTHGNLPKAGLAYLWSPRWLTTASYSKSVSGNLGTELVSGRIDYYVQGPSRLNLFVGGAAGQASPAVFNLNTGLFLPGRDLTAAFVGLSKPFKKSEITMAADYLNISGDPTDAERFTLTVNFTVFLRSKERPR